MTIKRQKNFKINIKVNRQFFKVKHSNIQVKIFLKEDFAFRFQCIYLAINQKYIMAFIRSISFALVALIAFTQAAPQVTMPEMPKQPEMPAVESPTAPEMPEAPKQPEMPAYEAPKQPEMPAVESPTAPEMPETPKQPEMPEVSMPSTGNSFMGINKITNKLNTKNKNSRH